MATKLTESIHQLVPALEGLSSAMEQLAGRTDQESKDALKQFEADAELFAALVIRADRAKADAVAGQKRRKTVAFASALLKQAAVDCQSAQMVNGVSNDNVDASKRLVDNINANIAEATDLSNRLDGGA